MSDLLDPLPDAPVTRRRENTRMRLVRASLGVFADRGIDGATIDDLVSAAGFTRGAFYSSFSKKEEVFDAVFTTVTDEVIHIIEQSVEQMSIFRAERSPSDEVSQMIAVFSAIRPHGRQWYLLYSEAVAHALRSEDSREALNAQRQRLRDAIAEVLRRGVELRGRRCLIPESDLAQLLIGVFVDLMVREHLDGAEISDLASRSILGVVSVFVVDADEAGEQHP